MLKTALDVTVPVLVFLLMTIVGMELTAEDFRRVARRFRVVAAATAAQIVFWPLAALVLLAALPLKPYVAAGLLLVAVCPSGGMANFYTYLGRGNLALSVTLTAVSCAAAVLSMPLLLAAFRTRLDDPATLDVPVLRMIGQLLFLLILPTLVGMLVRRARPDLAARHGRPLLGLGLAALVALLAFVVAQEWQHLTADLAEIALSVILLTGVLLPAGWAAGWAGGLGAGDRFAVAMVLVVRNVGIATAVAVTVLGRTEFAVFATGYFLVQTPLLLAALLLFRWARRSSPAAPPVRLPHAGRFRVE
jgi:BASS family bile acid:Na+ symporter